MSTKSGFFEEDEPVEKIRDAFKRGEKGITKAPDSAKAEGIRVAVQGVGSFRMVRSGTLVMEILARSGNSSSTDWAGQVSERESQAPEKVAEPTS